MLLLKVRRAVLVYLFVVFHRNRRRSVVICVYNTYIYSWVNIVKHFCKKTEKISRTRKRRVAIRIKKKTPSPPPIGFLPGEERTIFRSRLHLAAVVTALREREKLP